MAIQEVKGNLIEMCEDGIVDGMVHGCNCMHAMGSGIAGQLARKYPVVPQVDRETTTFGDFSKIGTFSVPVVIAENGNLFEVYNAYTQKTPSYDGSDVFEYEAFPVLLGNLIYDLEWAIGGGEKEGWKYRIGFPQIGAGLAGGDWPRIRQMIVDAFEDHPSITAVLVEYQR